MCDQNSQPFSTSEQKLHLCTNPHLMVLQFSMECSIYDVTFSLHPQLLLFHYYFSPHLKTRSTLPRFKKPHPNSIFFLNFSSLRGKINIVSNRAYVMPPLFPPQHFLLLATQIPPLFRFCFSRWYFFNVTCLPFWTCSACSIWKHTSRLCHSPISRLSSVSALANLSRWTLSLPSTLGPECWHLVSIYPQLSVIFFTLNSWQHPGCHPYRRHLWARNTPLTSHCVIPDLFPTSPGHLYMYVPRMTEVRFTGQ